MSRLLDINGLVVSLKKTGEQLVRGISFSLEAGKSLVMLGQSGCGKTMTCYAVMGLLDPARFHLEGRLCFEQTNLLALPRKERQRLYGGAIAMIQQNPMTAFNPSIRIGKQMTETLMLHQNGLLSRNEQRIEVMSALTSAGLSEAERIYKSYPFELSCGMLQRVMIALVHMSRARLVVADEPTTALDVQHRNETVQSFRKLRDNGTAVLLVTHDFSVAAQLGGAMLVMKDGEIVEHGEVNELLKAPKYAYTKALLSASRLSGEERSC